MPAIIVEGGKPCPECGLKRDTLFADGSRILYGQGLGHLVVTEDGRRFIAKAMMEEWMDDILIVAAYVAGRQDLAADDRVYMASRRLLAAVIDDMPDRLK